MSTHGAKAFALAAVILLFSMALAVALSLWLSSTALNRNDSRWCDTLNLLTSQPVAQPADPASNPSREQAYRLYDDFVMLKRSFGC